MSDYMRPHLLLFILPIALVSFVSSLAGQNVTMSVGSASGTPGATVSVGVSFTSSNGAQPTAFQFTVSFPAGSVTSASALVGSSASAAGKSLSCSNGSGSITCLVFGLNTTVVASGNLASISLQIAPSATNSFPLSLSGASASDG